MLVEMRIEVPCQHGKERSVEKMLWGWLKWVLAVVAFLFVFKPCQ